MPDVISLQTFDAVNTRDAILIAVRAGKLDDGELHVDLMSDRPRALFLMIIVHDQCGMNDSRYPAQQGQEDAQKKTTYPSGHQYRQRREHHTEKIPQRFHFCFFLVADVLRAPLVFTNS